LQRTAELAALAQAQLGESADWEENSAILKDEDRCIRCALCVDRCPADAIAMERVTFRTEWRIA
jgi:NAD-dependent dihydropyrimidine dehydrogenase PreA subunit